MLRLLTHKYYITVSRTDAVKAAVKAHGRAPAVVSMTELLGGYYQLWQSQIDKNYPFSIDSGRQLKNNNVQVSPHVSKQ